MLVFEDDEGLVFWPEHEVAAVTPEGSRWRVVTRTGSVGYRTEGPTSGQWRALGNSWVRPEWLNEEAAGWRDPAGFLHPREVLQELPIPPHDSLLGLEGREGGGCRWLYDDHCQDSPLSVEQAAGERPELVRIRSGLYLNRCRLRRWSGDGLWLDNGREFCALSKTGWRNLARRLQLPDPYHLPFGEPLLRKWRLRAYPVELATAAAVQLRDWFDQPRQLIANLVWQTLQYSREGKRPEYGSTHRGYWYEPVFPTLFRAGFSQSKRDRSPDSDLCVLYRRVLEEMVGDDRLLTYRELGFVDPGGRQLGNRRPEVVILCEKESLSAYLELVYGEFGVTVLVSGGMTKLLDSEYLVEDLRKAGVARVVVLAYVDFDPEGWTMPEVLLNHVMRYGLQADLQIRYLVRPECFTEEELELYSMPCPAPNAAARTRLRHWVERSGGIAGKGWGIHANHLKPVERVMARVRELLP